MNCDCIKRVNEKLADQNLALDVSFVFSTNPPYDTLFDCDALEGLNKEDSREETNYNPCYLLPFLWRESEGLIR